MGDPSAPKQIDPACYPDERFGLPTVRDILRELEKPGRDPRPRFKTAAFHDDVHDLKGLASGMLLEGVVINVTHFGVFVDIGVHQDGLVHISMMSHRFVKDPRQLVKAGDVVKVKVLEVDLQRRRIALTMKLDEAAARAPSRSPQRDSDRIPRRESPRPAQRVPGACAGEPARNGVMADALARALKR